jgi:SAM-dependent methyltransferase
VSIKSESNTYSHRWFEFFHVGISDSRTTSEVDFISSFAPLHQFRTVVDVCCGMGRHARALSKRGYTVTGVDRDLSVLAKARELGCGPGYLQADLRDYQPGIGGYDLAIVMGQSFGHFDAVTNRTVLGRLAAGVRERGRLILDLWNPDFFVSHPGERDFDLPDGVVHETKRVQDSRLFVRLTYPSGEQEDFEWQLFTRAEMEAVGAPLALTLLACCTDFDCSAEPCVSKPRIQFVLEHSGRYKRLTRRCS